MSGPRWAHYEAARLASLDGLAMGRRPRGSRPVPGNAGVRWVRERRWRRHLERAALAEARNADKYGRHEDAEKLRRIARKR